MKFIDRLKPVKVFEDILVPPSRKNDPVGRIKVKIDAFKDPVDGEIYIPSSSVFHLDDRKEEALKINLAKAQKRAKYSHGKARIRNLADVRRLQKIIESRPVLGKPKLS